MPKRIEQDILRWALSKNEIGILFFGRGKEVKFAIRVPNVASGKTNHFQWCLKSYSEACCMAKDKGLMLIAEGHSHSKKEHLRHPSNDDLRYFKKGIHIIVFPHEKKIRCWHFIKKLSQTVVFDVQIKYLKNS